MTFNDPSKILTIAVGDIHGCNTKLDGLLAACASYAGERTSRFIFLGDYIDRGRNSRAVVDRLILFQKQNQNSVICLKGNHEQMLDRAVRDSLSLVNWLTNGGNATLDSYRADHPRSIPFEHRAWLKSLPLYFDDGQRFFVHAGVDPFSPLTEQVEDVLLWVRDEFPEDVDVGRLVVHGHTPLLSGEPDLRRHRLNLDTAAFTGGPLTAAVFTNEEILPTAFITDTGRITPVSNM
jgi:serine/threonine protein phosphatase 1